MELICVYCGSRDGIVSSPTAALPFSCRACQKSFGADEVRRRLAETATAWEEAFVRTPQSIALPGAIAWLYLTLSFSLFGGLFGSLVASVIGLCGYGSWAYYADEGFVFRHFRVVRLPTELFAALVVALLVLAAVCDRVQRRTTGSGWAGLGWWTRVAVCAVVVLGLSASDLLSEYEYQLSAGSGFSLSFDRLIGVSAALWVLVRATGRVAGMTGIARWLPSDRAKRFLLATPTFLIVTFSLASGVGSDWRNGLQCLWLGAALVAVALPLAVLTRDVRRLPEPGRSWSRQIGKDILFWDPVLRVCALAALWLCLRSRDVALFVG